MGVPPPPRFALPARVGRQHKLWSAPSTREGMGCAPVALVFLLVARAATACRSTSLGVDLPDTGVTLAPGIVAVDAFVQQDSIAAILAALPNGPQWYPLPAPGIELPIQALLKAGGRSRSGTRCTAHKALGHLADAQFRPADTCGRRDGQALQYKLHAPCLPSGRLPRAPRRRATSQRHDGHISDRPS